MYLFPEHLLLINAGDETLEETDPLSEPMDQFQYCHTTRNQSSFLTTLPFHQKLGGNFFSFSLERNTISFPVGPPYIILSGFLLAFFRRYCRVKVFGQTISGTE